MVVKYQSALHRISFGTCSFSVAARTIWICLPPAHQMCTSADTFAITSTPTISSRPSNPLSACASDSASVECLHFVYKSHLFIYLLLSYSFTKKGASSKKCCNNFFKKLAGTATITKKKQFSVRSCSNRCSAARDVNNQNRQTDETATGSNGTLRS